MIRFFGLFLLLTLGLFARYEAYPTQSCPAFNNLKHTKNTHNITLDTKREYTVLKKHKGQYLIIVKGENPAQRWVDGSCFDEQIQKSTSKESTKQELLNFASADRFIDEVLGKEKVVKSKDNILALTWHNAFCETHRYKKECKRSGFALGKGKYSERHFVLHGLWPQPRSKVYCNVDKELVQVDKHGQWQHLPCLVMEEETEKRLEKVMPGYASGLHKHEWIKHGTCYGTDADVYFEDSVNFTEQFNNSKAGKFFSNQMGKRVTLQQIRSQVDRSFGQGAGKRVELRCKNGMITELWLHLGSGSDDLGTLLKRGKVVRSKCQGGMVDKAGFR